MSNHHITVATSVTGLGNALADMTGGTLIVDAGAFLLSQGFGNGALLSGFTSITINGTVGTFDNAGNGLVVSPLTNEVMNLIVGASGFIFSNAVAVNALEVGNINNAGLISGVQGITDTADGNYTITNSGTFNGQSANQPISQCH